METKFKTDKDSPLLLMVPELDEFFTHSRTWPGYNPWIRTPYMEVYVRISKRVNPLYRHASVSNLVEMFQLGNVVVQPKWQKQGLFTAWMDYAEDKARENGLNWFFVESIMSPIMMSILLNRGYQVIEGLVPHCMYLNLKEI